MFHLRWVRPASLLLTALLIAAACASTGINTALESASSGTTVPDTTAPPADPTLPEATTTPPSPSTAPSSEVPEAVTPPTTDEPNAGVEPSIDTVGSAGLGDTYFPTAGNGGYDALHYNVELDVDPDANVLDATATIELVTTQDLSSLNLDFRGMDVSAVEVNDTIVDFRRADDELTVEFATVYPQGSELEIEVSYRGVPENVIEPTIDEIGWLDGPVGSYVVSEPIGTPSWIPVNDHPLDKATFTFVVTVPEGWQVAANGLLVSTTEVSAGGVPATTFRWQHADPMAPYLATVAIGKFVFTTEDGPDGIVIRNAIPPRLVDNAEFDFGRTAEMIDVFVDLFGPYPFEAYGSLVIEDSFGFALETQSLSLYSQVFVSGDRSAEPIFAHEIAHQWFGNSVSVARWQDIWLNEGFASYAETLWREFGPDKADPGPTMDAVWNRSSSLGPPGDPGAGRLFAPTVYQRGQLVLHALRLVVGDESFFTILKTWAAENKYNAASTEDFITMAERVSGQDVRPLIESFLFDEQLPPLPS